MSKNVVNFQFVNNINEYSNVPLSLCSVFFAFWFDLKF